MVCYILVVSLGNGIDIFLTFTFKGLKMNISTKTINHKTINHEAINTLTLSNAISKTSTSDNTISVYKELTIPYYDRVTGGLSEEEINSMEVRGYAKCSMGVDSVFSSLVSSWVEDETIVPLGYVVSDAGKHYYWGNDEVVFWATIKQLVAIKEEVEEMGYYSGQLSCFSWSTVKHSLSHNHIQFTELFVKMNREVRQELFA